MPERGTRRAQADFGRKLLDVVHDCGARQGDLSKAAEARGLTWPWRNEGVLSDLINQPARRRIDIPLRPELRDMIRCLRDIDKRQAMDRTLANELLNAAGERPLTSDDGDVFELLPERPDPGQAGRAQRVDVDEALRVVLNPVTITAGDISSKLGGFDSKLLLIETKLDQLTRLSMVTQAAFTRVPTPTGPGGEQLQIETPRTGEATAAQALEDVSEFQSWLFPHADPQQLQRTRSLLTADEMRAMLQIAVAHYSRSPQERAQSFDSYARVVARLAPRLSPDEQRQALLERFDNPEAIPASVGLVRQPTVVELDENTKRTLRKMMDTIEDSVRPWVEEQAGVAAAEVPTEVFLIRLREALARSEHLTHADLHRAAEWFTMGYMPGLDRLATADELHAIREYLAELDDDNLRTLMLMAFRIVWEYTLFGEACHGGVPLSRATGDDYMRGLYDAVEGTRVFSLLNSPAINDFIDQFFERTDAIEIQRCSPDAFRRRLPQYLRVLSEESKRKVMNQLGRTPDERGARSELIAGLRRWNHEGRLIQLTLKRWPEPVTLEVDAAAMAGDAVPIPLAGDDAARFRQGIEAFKRGDWAEAVQCLRASLAAAPDNVEIADTLCRALSNLDDPQAKEESLKMAEELLKRAPDSRSVLETAAGLFLKQGRFPRVLTICGKLLQVSPGNLLAHEFAFLASLGDISAGAQLFDNFAQSVGAGPADIEEAERVRVLAARGKDPVVTLIRSIPTEERRVLSLGLWWLALERSARAKFERAELVFLALHALQPSNAFVTLYRLRNLCTVLNVVARRRPGGRLSWALIGRAARIAQLCGGDDVMLVALRSQLVKARGIFPDLPLEQQRAFTLRNYEACSPYLEELAHRLAAARDVTGAVGLYKFAAREFSSDPVVWPRARRRLGRYPDADVAIDEAIGELADDESSES